MSVFKKISAVVLALLVLCSTFSFTIKKHFCGDSLVDASYFGAVESCEMETGKDSCSLEESCCSDEIHHIDGQNDLQLPTVKKEKQVQFIIAFSSTYYNLFTDFSKQIIPYKNYQPPNLVADIQVLHEVFII